MRTHGVEIRDACPYCEYAFAVDARDIAGSNHVLRCLDCKQLFVVEVSVAVSHQVHALADIDRDTVLDGLAPTSGKPPTAERPAKSPRKGAAGRRREVVGSYGGGA